MDFSTDLLEQYKICVQSAERLHSQCYLCIYPYYHSGYQRG